MRVRACERARACVCVCKERFESVCISGWGRVLEIRKKRNPCSHKPLIPSALIVSLGVHMQRRRQSKD